MSMYNHADGAVQFPATRVYNAPGQGCTTAATYSPECKEMHDSVNKIMEKVRKHAEAEKAAKEAAKYAA